MNTHRSITIPFASLIMLEFLLNIVELDNVIGIAYFHKCLRFTLDTDLALSSGRFNGKKKKSFNYALFLIVDIVLYRCRCVQSQNCLT